MTNEEQVEQAKAAVRTVWPDAYAAFNSKRGLWKIRLSGANGWEPLCEYVSTEAEAWIAAANQVAADQLRAEYPLVWESVKFDNFANDDLCRAWGVLVAERVARSSPSPIEGVELPSIEEMDTQDEGAYWAHRCQQREHQLRAALSTAPKAIPGEVLEAARTLKGHRENGWRVAGKDMMLADYILGLVEGQPTPSTGETEVGG